jgi:hypothetical protein
LRLDAENKFSVASKSKFNGSIEPVQIDIGDDSHDHLVEPVELIRVAMSRQ